jgi:hypothetical protein
MMSFAVAVDDVDRLGYLDNKHAYLEAPEYRTLPGTSVEVPATTSRSLSPKS